LEATLDDLLTQPNLLTHVDLTDTQDVNNTIPLDDDGPLSTIEELNNSSKLFERTPVKKQKVMHMDITSFTQRKTDSIRSTTLESKLANELTFALNYLPSKSTEDNVGSIKVEEVIDSKGLLSAFLTTYKVELKWLLNKVPCLKKCPVTIVHGDEALKTVCYLYYNGDLQ
jgi:hypothetical protein